MTTSLAEPEVASATLDVVRRNNNFDSLRILAALAVIVGHSFILTGRLADSPTVAGLPLEYLGVSTFFIISGWLITGSWERSRSVGQYVSSRALRIAPLLFTVILLSTFALGPLVTTLGPGEYFASSGTWRYLINLVLLPADGLPGVFDSVPFPGVVNGSVWTLRAEVICYIAVLGLGFLPRRIQLVGFAAFGVLAIALVLAGPVVIAGASVSAAAGTWVYFAIGGLARLLLKKSFFRLDVAAAVAVAWLVAGTLLPSVALPIAWLALSYCVLAFGLASTPVFRRAARFGDLSYGMYLWAFPVQQLVVQSFGALPIPVNLAIVVAICLVLSYASWHLVEKPTLELRFRLPFFSRPA